MKGQIKWWYQYVSSVCTADIVALEAGPFTQLEHPPTRKIRSIHANKRKILPHKLLSHKPD